MHTSLIILPPRETQPLCCAGNLFISFVGAGVLGLPHAFQRTGLLQGGIFMLVVAGLNLHCMMLLVRIVQLRLACCVAAMPIPRAKACFAEGCPCAGGLFASRPTQRSSSDCTA